MTNQSLSNEFRVLEQKIYIYELEIGARKAKDPELPKLRQELAALVAKRKAMLTYEIALRKKIPPEELEGTYKSALQYVQHMYD